MGSYLLFFLLGWTNTVARILVYFEDYYKNKKDNDKGGI